jgi:IS5 family transposase
MSQMSFGDAKYAGKWRKTRREEFAAEIAWAIPWSSLLKLIEPSYPVADRAAPYQLEATLRVHRLQV